MFQGVILTTEQYYKKINKNSDSKLVLTNMFDITEANIKYA